MAWTYGTDPVIDGTAAQKRDAIRVLSQTNISSTQTPIADEEIAFAILQEENIFQAAGLVAEMMAGRTAGRKSKKAGKLTITYGSDHYMALASQLRSRLAHQLPWAGGLSVTERDAAYDDSDWIQGRMQDGQFDYPGAS